MASVFWAAVAFFSRLMKTATRKIQGVDLQTLQTFNLISGRTRLNCGRLPFSHLLGPSHSPAWSLIAQDILRGLLESVPQ